MSLLIAKVADGCGCVLRADVVQHLEQLGFLHISLQQPLDLGFSSAIKFVMPNQAGMQDDRTTIFDRIDAQESSIRTGSPAAADL